MIALPSIAFEGFSGSAKGVTARRVGGRNILSCKCWPTGAATVAQVARRASLKKISKSWKLLSSEQMQEWDRLAEHAAGASVLGKKAELTGQNLYVRLNVNRQWLAKLSFLLLPSPMWPFPTSPIRRSSSPLS